MPGGVPGGVPGGGLGGVVPSPGIFSHFSLSLGLSTVHFHLLLGLLVGFGELLVQTHCCSASL